MSNEPSNKTKKEVYDRWNGRCAFCGVFGTVDQHHIIAKSEDPTLINVPDNLVLLCSIHHRLTQKSKPTGSPVISFREIKDLTSSKYANSSKFGFHFDAPQDGRVILGGNSCMNYPYILVVNKKPLIEMWSKKPVHYAKELGFFVTMRFF